MSDNKSLLKSELELWGGMECTINRVGEQYYDQLSEAGHYSHPRQLDMALGLNLKAFRYPILWERYEKSPARKIDFSFADSGLRKLRAAGITPVVGLLHHGSGPEFTNLLDEEFGEKFQRYASKVAEAFPDVQYYTPINEPLTTARFSGLYGFWYPHASQPLDFARMLLHQLKATVLAMKAIRGVNPSAKLVQTEDLAKVHATHPLQYQADFENERRWLSFDLLVGSVDENHPMWGYLTGLGIRPQDLHFFLDNPCPPDLLGLNYYVTSERFLDHRCALYPHEVPGSNGIDTYIDISACRSDVPINLDTLLHEAWSRYRIPMAITEAHLSCTREEQLRWFKEVWESAQRCKSDGVDIRAVTAWSLLGAFDWDSLVTARNHHYESGVFDNETYLRPTALATMLKKLGGGERYDHPLLAAKGWWRQAFDEVSQRPLLVVGEPGSFMAGLKRVCQRRRIHFITLNDDHTDYENMSDLLSVIANLDPWAIVDALDMSDESGMTRDNVHATVLSHNLATASMLQGVPHMLFTKCGPAKNTAAAETNKANCLAGSAIEALVAKACPSALIIRTAETFSPWDPGDFAFEIIEALRTDRALRVPTNVNIMPTYLPHLLNRALDLLIDMESGTWTLTNHHGTLSWSEFASDLARFGGFSRNNLIHAKEHGNTHSPRMAAMGQPPGRSIKLPDLHQAIEEYLVQLNY